MSWFLEEDEHGSDKWRLVHGDAYQRRIDQSCSARPVYHCVVFGRALADAVRRLLNNGDVPEPDERSNGDGH